MGYFGNLSKTSKQIWFNLLVKENIIVLHIDANFEVENNVDSRDIGSNEFKNRALRVYIMKLFEKLVNQVVSICFIISPLLRLFRLFSSIFPTKVEPRASRKLQLSLKLNMSVSLDSLFLGNGCNDFSDFLHEVRE